MRSIKEIREEILSSEDPADTAREWADRLLARRRVRAWALRVGALALSATLVVLVWPRPPAENDGGLLGRLRSYGHQDEQLTDEEERELQRIVAESTSTRDVRLALERLANDRRRVDTSRIVAILESTEVAETLDLPEDLAGVSHDESELLAKRVKWTKTVQVALFVLLEQERRFGERPDASVIEPFVGFPDFLVKMRAVMLLALDESYTPPECVCDRIVADKRLADVSSAKLLLSRTK